MRGAILAVVASAFIIPFPFFLLARSRSVVAPLMCLFYLQERSGKRSFGRCDISVDLSLSVLSACAFA